MLVSDMREFKNRRNVLTCSPEDTVYDAVVSMTHKRCGAIAVTVKSKLVGIFTERDLLARVVGQGYDVESTKISDVMSRDIETVTPHASVTLCIGRMDHGRFRHLPVLDKDGNLVGMLSQRDFLAHATRELIENPGPKAKNKQVS